MAAMMQAALPEGGKAQVGQARAAISTMKLLKVALACCVLQRQGSPTADLPVSVGVA